MKPNSMSQNEIKAQKKSSKRRKPQNSIFGKKVTTTDEKAKKS
jgi:hypothetical protein